VVDSNGKREKDTCHSYFQIPLEMYLVTAVVRTMKELSESWTLFELSLQFVVSSSAASYNLEVRLLMTCLYRDSHYFSLFNFFFPLFQLLLVQHLYEGQVTSFQHNYDFVCVKTFCNWTCTGIAPDSCFVTEVQLDDFQSEAVDCVAIESWDEFCSKCLWWYA